MENFFVVDVILGISPDQMAMERSSTPLRKIRERCQKLEARGRMKVFRISNLGDLKSHFQLAVAWPWLNINRLGCSAFFIRRDRPRSRQFFSFSSLIGFFFYFLRIGKIMLCWLFFSVFQIIKKIPFII